MARDKRAKFIELAEKRVDKTLKLIELIGNLANKSNYEYDQQDVRKIFAAIDEKVKITKSQFSWQDDNKKEFKL